MHETLSLHEDNAYSKSNGVVIVSEHHNKNIMPEFRNACLQEYAKDALFEGFPFSPKSYFEKYPNNTYFKNRTQKLFEIFSNKS